MEEAIQECLDQTLLSDLSGNIRIKNPQPTEGWAGKIDLTLRLPKNFKWDHCVLQVWWFSSTLISMSFFNLILYNFSSGNGTLETHMA